MMLTKSSVLSDGVSDAGILEGFGRIAYDAHANSEYVPHVTSTRISSCFNWMAFKVAEIPELLTVSSCGVCWI